MSEVGNRQLSPEYSQRTYDQLGSDVLPVRIRYQYCPEKSSPF